MTIELTQEESQVLQLISSGCTNNDVQDTLLISPFKCKRIIRDIKDKFNAKTTAHAVAIGIRKGFIHL